MRAISIQTTTNGVAPGRSTMLQWIASYQEYELNRRAFFFFLKENRVEGHGELEVNLGGGGGRGGRLSIK